MEEQSVFSLYQKSLHSVATLSRHDDLRRADDLVRLGYEKFHELESHHVDIRLSCYIVQAAIAGEIEPLLSDVFAHLSDKKRKFHYERSRKKSLLQVKDGLTKLSNFLIRYEREEYMPKVFGNFPCFVRSYVQMVGGCFAQMQFTWHKSVSDSIHKSLAILMEDLSSKKKENVFVLSRLILIIQLTQVIQHLEEDCLADMRAINEQAASLSVDVPLCESWKVINNACSSYLDTYFEEDNYTVSRRFRKRIDKRIEEIAKWVNHLREVYVQSNRSAFEAYVDWSISCMAAGYGKGIFSTSARSIIETELGVYLLAYMESDIDALQSVIMELKDLASEYDVVFDTDESQLDFYNRLLDDDYNGEESGEVKYPMIAKLKHNLLHADIDEIANKFCAMVDEIRKIKNKNK